MTQNVFSFDGKYYDVCITKLKLLTEKIANENSGRLKNLKMFLKYDGIFINYEIEIKKKNGKNKEFFELFNKIVFDKENPEHKIILPYGNKMYNFTAYCSGPAIDMKKFNGANEFDDYDSITVKLIAIDKTESPL